MWMSNGDATTTRAAAHGRQRLSGPEGHKVGIVSNDSFLATGVVYPVKPSLTRKGGSMLYIKFADGDVVATEGDRLKRSLAVYLLYKGGEETGRFPVRSVLAH